MDADLDTLCTAVHVTADDLLPERRANARRELTDAEVLTLAVAQVMTGIPSDRRFLAVARVRLGHLFPHLPRQPAATPSAGASCARRSTGSPASLPPAARASTTTCCCWTPRRSSAPARWRPRAARAFAFSHGWLGLAYREQGDHNRAGRTWNARSR